MLDLVTAYLKSPDKKPYFIFTNDSEYIPIRDDLTAFGFKLTPLSTFCMNGDKIPDIDALVSSIVKDSAIGKKKIIVTGIGEFLALSGEEEAMKVLRRLKNQGTGGAKVIFLIRALNSLIAKLQKDLRYDSRRYAVIDSEESSLSLLHIDQSVIIAEALDGFKALLSALEKGGNGKIVVKTGIRLNKSMFAVNEINSSYEYSKLLLGGIELPQGLGTDELWAKFLMDLNSHEGTIDSFFGKYGLHGDLEASFNSFAFSDDYLRWLYFLCLKINASSLKNAYLRFAVDMTSSFSGFLDNILNAINQIKHTDKRFLSFYTKRKALVERFPESDIAKFVINTRINPEEAIYRLTDNTLVEREEIIAWVSKYGQHEQLRIVYPALAFYLKRYVFECRGLSDRLTSYFDDYKRQKLSSKLEEGFLELVEELAVSKEFNQLHTRDEVIFKLDKSDSCLYWLDALGVEYLSLIEALANKRDLSIKINIAVADLPTITSINKGFYDLWPNENKNKVKKLDNIKHNSVEGRNFTDNQLPIHLASELDVIASMIDTAATELAAMRCKRFIIASDHGASRLAVLRKKEEKYDTGTTGEHSGRCCKAFYPYDLPFAQEENGYIVLADYGRFKGSRAASVEVHGGASLEEVVVPIIELMLKDVNIKVSLIEETVIVDRNTGAEISLFFTGSVKDVYVVINDKKYPAFETDDSNHFSVKLPDIKRAGVYTADVYQGSSLIDQIEINAQGKSGRINNAFDDLF